MRTSIDIENVLFGAFVALLVTISAVMGTIVFDKPAHPVDKTIRTIVPATVENIEINQRFADEYRKLRPEIHVEMSVFPWRTITQKMEFLMMAGIPPDVVSLGPSELQRFIHLGAVEPLENWMRNDPDFDPEAFFPECLSDSNWDGVQWGVPYTFSTVCLWYNKSLFDKEGVPYPNRDWTWDDLLAAAKKMTKDTDGDGLLDQWGFVNNNYHWNRMPMWIWMNGGEFMTPDLRTATFNTPGVIGGLAWLRDLSVKEKVSPSYATLRTVGPVNLFLSGKVGMTTETRYFLPQFRLEKNRDKTASFEWDVCELPRGVRRASTFVMSSNFMPSGISPERKKMAWDFIKFLSSETGQRIMASLDTSIPARKSVAYEMVDHPGKAPRKRPRLHRQPPLHALLLLALPRRAPPDGNQ